MTRESVDPYCGHLWALHSNGTGCPPDEDETVAERLEWRRVRGFEHDHKWASGPAELTSDDDAADARDLVDRWTWEAADPAR